MGIHDYIDFIQRNGQHIGKLDYAEDEEESFEDTGSSEAILVRIPTTYTKRDILSWPLTEFAKFPAVKYNYSWDNWDFEPALGYHEVLSGDKEWYDQTIWQSSAKSGEWLVNFEPEEYNAFVLGKGDPTSISWNYYKFVFQNRNMGYLFDSFEFLSPELRNQRKIYGYNLIVNSGERNLLEYDRGKIYFLNSIPFVDIALKLNSGEFSRFEFIPEFQNQKKNSNNLIATFYGKNDNTYNIELRYDQTNHQILPSI
jgi:hypothetical protein